VASKKLPVLSHFVLAYSDVARALRAMPLLFGCGILIVLAVRIGEDFFWFRGMRGPLDGNLLGLAVSAVRGFCLTPIMIAIHRFIIRDQVTRGYDIDLSRNFLRFFGWAFLLSVLFTFAFVTWELLNASGASTMTALVIFFVLLIALAILFLRLAILFPALAVDAAGATAANALAGSKGYGLRIFAIFLLVLLPMAVLPFLVTIALGRGVLVQGSALAITSDVFGAVIQIAITALSVAAASRIYQAIGAKVRTG
jgi:hypothetical protein